MKSTFVTPPLDTHTEAKYTQSPLDIVTLFTFYIPLSPLITLPSFPLLSGHLLGKCI